MKKILLLLLLITSKLWSQEEKYTPLEMLYISSMSYEEEYFKEKLPPSLKSIKDIYGMNEKGFYEDLSTDYQAAVLLDTLNNTIFIAHRGTEFEKKKDVVADLQIVYLNLKKNNNLEAFDSIKKNPIIAIEFNQYNSALELLDSIQAKYPSPKYTIINVGHSLGGGVSQLVGAKTSTQSVTFDAPGVKKIAEIFNIPTNVNNQTNYVVKNSGISNWKKVTRGHLGEVIPLYPFSPHNLLENNPLGSLKYHRTPHLIEAFNPETGEVLELENYARELWKQNKTILIKNKLKKPKNYFKNFEEFYEFYKTQYSFKGYN